MTVAEGVRTEVAELLDLAAEPAGARFRLADLQLHTPVDKNFRPGASVDSPGQRAGFARQYVEKAVSSGLAIIAITEHNDVSWIDQIREAARELDLIVFPGFEIAASEGVHVLGLFEPDSDASRLDELLIEMGLPRVRRWHSDGSPKMSKLPLAELVAFVQDQGGVCILSHVDRDDGVLRRLEGEPRVHAWQESGALAVQCSKNPRLMEEGFHRRVLMNEHGVYHRERAYACIQTSDARSLDDIGSKATYVKMSSRGLEGLRQAFRDPESRIRFPDEHDVGVYPKILAAKWDGAFLEAAFASTPT